MKRSAGILLPIFSLPSDYGIGSLGKEARAFADFLHDAGQSWWQILPVGPTGQGNSPYTSASTFAGNPLFIDLETLAASGLLDEADLDAARLPVGSKVDYESVCRLREPLLRKAAARAWEKDGDAIRAFADGTPWLREYTLFQAARSHFGCAWCDWPDEALRRHESAAVEQWRKDLEAEIAYHTCVQYWFFSQWAALKEYVNNLGIRIIGDVPIYVSLDSSDVWSEREQFLLDKEGKPSKVAGVPPDYFSEDGQLWGNPLYDWASMKQDGFSWWIRRVGGAARLFDAIRIDHFRGLESYWAVPYGETSARIGRWVKGPGMDLIGVLTAKFPNIQFIAEDLGYLTPEVRQLLQESGLPGMKVLQFAFDSRESSNYLPHTYPRHCVCYAGTHDNSTLMGWKNDADPADIATAREYLGLNEEEGFHWGILRGGQSSVADLFVAQMQDYLGLGSEARMNTPGILGGNWQWRMLPGQITEGLTKRIAHMTSLYGRSNESWQM